MQNFNDIDAQKYLIFVLQNKENITTLIRGLLKPIHEKKEELKEWSVQRSPTLATGTSLDGLGSLVDVKREGRDDATLRRLIQAKGVQLKNTGTYPDLKSVVQILTPPNTTWDLDEQTYFFVEGKTVPQAIVKILDPIDLNGNNFLFILGQIKPLGVDLRVELPPDDFDEVLATSDGENFDAKSNGLNGIGEGFLIPHVQV